MQQIKALGLVAILATFSLGQSIEVAQFEAITAKAVKVEQLGDSVAVLLTDRDPGSKTGAILKVNSEKRWATPLLDGKNITESSVKGEWLLFADPGSYRVMLIEFDPERGPSFSYHQVVIKGAAVPDPVTPVPPQPPTGFDELQKVAKAVADQLSDPKTRNSLAVAYRTALDGSAGKSYDEVVSAVKSSREFALRARLGESRLKDWDAWRQAVDSELVRAVKPGDVVSYVAAVRAIIDALGSREFRRSETADMKAMIREARCKMTEEQHRKATGSL